jgi:hypothetical protein
MVVLSKKKNVSKSRTKAKSNFKSKKSSRTRKVMRGGTNAPLKKKFSVKKRKEHETGEARLAREENRKRSSARAERKSMHKEQPVINYESQEPFYFSGPSIPKEKIEGKFPTSMEQRLARMTREEPSRVGQLVSRLENPDVNVKLTSVNLGTKGDVSREGSGPFSSLKNSTFGFEGEEYMVPKFSNSISKSPRNEYLEVNTNDKKEGLTPRMNMYIDNRFKTGTDYRLAINRIRNAEKLAQRNITISGASPAQQLKKREKLNTAVRKEIENETKKRDELIRLKRLVRASVK